MNNANPTLHPAFASIDSMHSMLHELEVRIAPFARPASPINTGSVPSPERSALEVELDGVVGHISSILERI